MSEYKNMSVPLKLRFQFRKKEDRSVIPTTHLFRSELENQLTGLLNIVLNEIVLLINEKIRNFQIKGSKIIHEPAVAIIATWTDTDVTITFRVSVKIKASTKDLERKLLEMYSIAMDESVSDLFNQEALLRSSVLIESEYIPDPRLGPRFFANDPSPAAAAAAGAGASAAGGAGAPAPRPAAILNRPAGQGQSKKAKQRAKKRAAAAGANIFNNDPAAEGPISHAAPGPMSHAALGAALNAILPPRTSGSAAAAAAAAEDEENDPTEMKGGARRRRTLRHRSRPSRR